MIKIIEPGTRTVTSCEYCGCKFSYEKEDIETDGLLVNNLVLIGIIWVVCPQCGKEIILKSII